MDNEVGIGAGLVGTFNMVNGSLTLNARLDTGATTSGSVGIVNQTAGTLLVNGQFQGANIGGGTSSVNLSGGSFSIVGATTFMASRGNGSFTVGGSAVATLGLLDVSRGIGLPTMGTVNLNSGGLLVVNQISTATANAASPVTGASANFNFNGGVLKASAASDSFIRDSSEGNVTIPLTVTVKSGGAIINDNGFAISCLEVLQHDSTLGSTNDGGLTKLGSGTLTLADANTYTGATTISNGTLAFGANGGISDSVTINIAAGAALDASGRSDRTLTLASGQTLKGSGSITGALSSSAGSTVAPGYTNAIGALAISGAVTLGGSTRIKLNGPGANDQLSSSTSLSYGGSLIVSNLPGNALAAGNTFILFPAPANSYINSFASIQLPALGANLAWQTNFLSVNGTISVVSTTPSTPNINNVLRSGGNLVFSGTNGPANGTFFVLTSTNIASPLSHWMVLSTNSFDASGNFRVTNAIVVGGSPVFFAMEVSQ